MGYQNPQMVAELVKASQELVSDKSYKEYRETLSPIDYPLGRSMVCYFKLLTQNYSFLNRLRLAQEVVGIPNIGKLQRLFGQGFVAVLTSYLYWKNRKRNLVDIPLFHKSEISIAKDWFIKDTNLSSQEVYEILGKAGIYSDIHRRNVCSVPIGFESRYKRRLKLFDYFFPLDRIPTDQISPEAQWRSHDRKRREEIASEVASFSKSYFKRTKIDKGIVLDIAGGNGELSHLIALEKDLPKGALIVVRELNIGMIEEGRSKIRALGLEDRVIFIQGDASEPFDRTLLNSKYSDAPVIAAVSTYTAGAMPSEISGKVLYQMYEDLSEGGLLVNCDFSNVPHDLTLKMEFMQQTEDAGRAFLDTRNYLDVGLQQCYKNWGHDVDNLNRSAKFLETAFDISLENKWEVTLFSMIPIWIGKKNTIVINIPGYVQRTVRVVK